MAETADPRAAGAAELLPLVATTPPRGPEEIVERWWQDHFPGSPVAQVTQAWNHAFAAKEELKRRLVNFVAGGV